MEDDSSFRYRVNYSENVAPKYPAGFHDGLEVVPHATPVYPLPARAPNHVIGDAPDVESEKWSPSSRGWSDAPRSAATAATALPLPPLPPSPPSDIESHKGKEEKRRVLGLTVPIFWTLVVIVFIILAAALGGGIGGGLKAQQQQKLADNASSDTATNGTSSSDSSSTPTSTSPTATTTVTSTGPLPSDSGCPLINNQTYTPYAVDGTSIPLEPGKEGQQFKQQCYTSYTSSATTQTHDILKIYMPTLENCIMACAAYNEAYSANLANNTGVGGGYCMGVTLHKVNSGFCYLKNATTTNDTMGHPDIYSSAVLINFDTAS
ncbi:hypothetical protein F5Y02DRAFT_417911 [Annulohypoxylon stygium]|nr:hypothetical protein F5Y02DRAFT_417911 [Annulohypoxylon stygium]